MMSLEVRRQALFVLGKEFSMSAAPRFEWKSRPNLVVMEGGRTRIAGFHEEDRSVSGTRSMGRVYFLALGCLMVAPILWYFTLMLLLPVAFVGLARAMLQNETARGDVAYLRPREPVRIERARFGPETPAAATEETRELELARAA